ncbi:MAG: hypothetical protein ACREWG_02075, partial [Gammaproteobacteria bacterium]
KPIGSLLIGWVVSGIEMARARSGLLGGTAGTCDPDVKGDVRSIRHAGGESRHRGRQDAT